MKSRWPLCTACALLHAIAPLWADLPPLIPREVLFGNPDRIQARISPDGKRLAYLAPDGGVLNVWVRTVGRSDDRPVTKDRKRGILWFFWAPDDERILFGRDRDGDENWHLYSVRPDTLEERDLTPFDGVQARVVAVELEHPDAILVALNRRKPEVHDVYRLELTTGKLTLEAENDREFTGWAADSRLRVRAASRMTPDGGVEIWVRNRKGSEWRTLLAAGPEDALTSEPVSFTRDGKGLYVLSSVGSNTSQLREIELATRKEKVLVSDAQVDVSEVLVHPVKHTVQAVGLVRARLEWKVLDPSVEKDFAALEKVHRGDLRIVGRDRADRVWLAAFTPDDGPYHYFSLDRVSGKADFLFTAREALEGVTLARMEPVSIQARDGLTLHGYLTAPPGMPRRGLPMVLLVHGGPWARDAWGYDGEVQWLANRGYAVLQVNFRGSTGYGKQFINAGDREWGGKMHDDLVDAVRWAVGQGVADPQRIAIFGGSYGGYATLAGLSFTPDLFACGVDIVGPSNLITLLNSIPPYWKPMQSLFHTRVGHPEKDSEFLKSRSPLFNAERIEKPLLIAQGANDPRVKKHEALQIVEALRKKGKSVEYVEYADEGHGFDRPENRLDFYARAEKFLAEHLGGRVEPEPQAQEPEEARAP